MYDYCVYNDCMYAAKATKGGILPKGKASQASILTLHTSLWRR